MEPRAIKPRNVRRHVAVRISSSPQPFHRSTMIHKARGVCAGVYHVRRSQRGRRSSRPSRPIARKRPVKPQSAGSPGSGAATIADRTCPSSSARVQKRYNINANEIFPEASARSPASKNVTGEPRVAERYARGSLGTRRRTLLMTRG